METLLVTLQFIVLAATLPLLVSSLGTSRGRSSRHMGLLTLASLLAIVAVLLAMFSLGDLAGGADADLALSFAPPLATVLLCCIVVWRAMGADRRNRRPMSSSVSSA